MGAPGQLHLPERRHGPALRRGSRPKGERGCTRACPPRLVRLDGRATRLLEGTARRGRGGKGGQPPYPRHAPRDDKARPQEAALCGRGVRLHGRGVYLGWLAGHLSRYGSRLPGHRRKHPRTGRRRCGEGLRGCVGRYGRAPARGRTSACGSYPAGGGAAGSDHSPGASQDENAKDARVAHGRSRGAPGSSPPLTSSPCRS